MEFQSPEFFLLLLGIIPLAIFYLRNNLKMSSLTFSSLEKVRRLPVSRGVNLRHLVFIFRILALVMLAAALARPQTGRKNAMVQSEGIDIMLCLDISDSMKGEDFLPDNRLEAAKNVIISFIKKRKNDRIGLAVFGSESFLQCPLTHDHGVLLDFLNRVNFHPEISRSTAIGMSLATAINALRKSQAKSKIIVLLTDGVNNAGEIHPLTAADLAASLDIKIYSIGIGKPGESEVLVTVDDPYFGRRKVPMRIEMDENILQAVSDAASGLYFNAQNTGMLEKIYNEINTLEKSKITTRQYLEYNEQFTFFLLAAAIFLLLEIILNHTRFRKLP